MIRQYQDFSVRHGIDFHPNRRVSPPDTTTLFTTSGMQAFKPRFSDPSVTGTLANVQTCLRLNDLDEIGDGTHFLLFNMMGLFSFRQMSVQEAVVFWLSFLQERGLEPDWVTIHPDRIDAWSRFYGDRYPIRADTDCVWSDGAITGYCTEFYCDGVEIGNIVNPLGTCIDVGFRLERLDMLLNGTPKPSAESLLEETVLAIIESGYGPSNKGQGYILRKLLRLVVKAGGTIDHPFFAQEVERQHRTVERYERLKAKHSDKDAAWWFSTHGIDLGDVL